MAPPKTILDKIIYAIRAQPPTHLDGPSRTAIVKYLQAEMDVDTKTKAVAIKNALKKGVEKGKLIQNGQRYRVVGDAIPEVAAEPEVKIEDIKEGKGEMCDVGDTVVMKYEGKLDDGTIFDSSSNFEFTLGAGEVIKGVSFCFIFVLSKIVSTTSYIHA